MITPTIYCADLYSGAGGASAGLDAAATLLGLKVKGVAINHWDTAIVTHSTNFPNMEHLLTEVEKVNPRFAVPSGKLNLLLAGPSCVHFSQARGGKPVSDQQRSGAWEVIHWARELAIENILVENVPAFLTWGPVEPETNRPYTDERKGAYFRQWCRMLRDLGYTVEHRIFCAADYGDATTRKRLFIQARRSGRITWPVPSHCSPETLHAFPSALPWKPARAIIDWTLPSKSVFGRKKQLADNTKARMLVGIDKICGIRLIGHETMSWDRPPLVLLRCDTLNPGRRLAFVLGQQSCSAARSTDDPIPTVSTAGAISLIEASFLLVNRTNCQPQSLDEPVSTLTTGNNMALVEADALTIDLKGTKPRQLEQTSHSIDEPLRTIHASGEHTALCQTEIEPVGASIFLDGTPAFVVPHPRGGGKTTGVRSVDSPPHTVTATSSDMALAELTLESFITSNFGDREGGKPRVHSIDDPLHTITTTSRGIGFAQPELKDACLVNVGGPAGASREPRSVDDPLRTIIGQNHTGVATVAEEALLLRYNGGKGGRDRSESLDAPLTTIDTSNRFGLVDLEPSIISYYGGSGGAQSVADPLDTITTRDRFGLVETEIVQILSELPDLQEGDTLAFLDIHFRMLQPQELAAAHSFPKDYVFAGGREDRVKQVGNSWPVELATALCRAILSDHPGGSTVYLPPVGESDETSYETSTGDIGFFGDFDDCEVLA